MHFWLPCINLKINVNEETQSLITSSQTQDQRTETVAQVSRKEEDKSRVIQDHARSFSDHW
jgi:hypothetical protein